MPRTSRAQGCPAKSERKKALKHVLSAPGCECLTLTKGSRPPNEKGVLCQVTSYIPNWAGYGGWARTVTTVLGKMFVFALSKPCLFLYLGSHTFEIRGTTGKRAPVL